MPRLFADARMNAFRVSRPVHVFALLALIAQLLLPVSHAATMAQRGDPLMLAFCGSVSPQSLQLLRQTAPPELLQAIADADAAARRAADLPCNFCAGLASVQMAAPLPSTPVLLLPLLADAMAPPRAVPPAQAAPDRHPPARGPPVFS